MDIDFKNLPILVLAGGRATRLKNLAIETPKYLMPVTPGQTFADVHLQWLSSLGFQQVYLSIGYLGEKIRNFCGDGEKWKLQIQYIEDGATPAGTGGAVRKALQFPFENLCVTYGDTLLHFSFLDFFGQFQKSQALGSMTVFENQVPGHTCNIGLETPWIIYDKQNPEPQWKYIDYGFMVLKRSLIESFPPQVPLDLAVPLSEASYQKKILGFPVKDRFWEIGSPEALAQFQARLQERFKS
jgi:MurNAc alpha-1-phosphate uridylyltransferase